MFLLGEAGTAWLEEVGLNPCHKPAVFPGRELLPCLAPPGSGFVFRLPPFILLSCRPWMLKRPLADGFQPLVVVVVVVVDLM